MANEADREKVEATLDQAVVEGMMLLLQTDPSLVLLLTTDHEARELVKAGLTMGAAGMAAVMFREGYADKEKFKTGG